MRVKSPIMISGLSFGAVSKATKLVIAETAKKLNIGFNSGEGGVLSEELLDNRENIILQYSTASFGVDKELFKSGAAIEIRFGQGAYPGKGSYLPAEKITDEVAKIRGLKRGEPSNSPAHHPDILNAQDLKKKFHGFVKLVKEYLWVLRLDVVMLKRILNYWLKLVWIL